MVDIICRVAVAVEGYKYFKAMVRKGIVWDEATMTGFLAKPKKLKGMKIAFLSLRKESDIADVIAYLKASK